MVAELRGDFHRAGWVSHKECLGMCLQSGARSGTACIKLSALPSQKRPRCKVPGPLLPS